MFQDCGDGSGCFVARANMKAKSLAIVFGANVDFDRPAIAVNQAPRRVREIRRSLIFAMIMERRPMAAGLKSAGMSVTELASLGKSCTKMSQLR